LANQLKFVFRSFGAERWFKQ